jgi:glycosyltransferase involved in cell wall biosynthesis
MLHPTWDRLERRVEQIDGVVARYVAQMHVYGYSGQRRYYRPLALLAVSWQAALALAAEAIRSRPELLHIAKPQPINGLAGILAARRLGIPLLVDCDDYEAGANRFTSAWQQRMVRFWEDHLPQIAAGVTVNTQFLRQRCQGFGIPDERIAYVPNGLSAGQFLRPPPGIVQSLRSALGLAQHPTLLYLGTISTVAHGVGLLIEAFARARQQLPQARLIMVGDGDDRASLVAMAARLGQQDSIRWTGRVAPAATRAFLALADASTDPVFATPAMAARSPLKIVESLAIGTPVITADVGDRRQVLEDAGGVIVQPGEPQPLADAIAMILSDPALRARHSSQALARAEDFRWERILHPWFAILNQARP